MRSWTTPFHGISHLLGLPHTEQVSIEDHGEFVTAFRLSRLSSSPFTPVAEQTFATVAEAQAWGEAQIPDVR